MRALFSIASTVPLSRVAREHRAWVLPLAAVIAINIGVLVGVVIPLVRSAGAATRRASAVDQALLAATADLKRAETTRDGQAQAVADLDRFYQQVLPADLAAARQMTHLRLSQLARKHDIAFERSASTPEEMRESDLERLKVGYSLAGRYDDIRRFIYAIETGSDFVVIDNLVLSEGVDGEALLSLALDLSTYYRLANRAP